MFRVPSARTTTSPASLSTLRCCDTAGRVTGFYSLTQTGDVLKPRNLLSGDHIQFGRDPDKFPSYDDGDGVTESQCSGNIFQG